MVEIPDNARERACEQATDWLILLQDEPGDADLLRRFESWLAESPLNADAWATTRSVMEIVGRTPPSLADKWRPGLMTHRDGHPIGVTGKSVSRVPTKQRRGIRAGYGLAGAALAACLAILLLPRVMLHVRADHLTGTGETRAIALADGSTVVMAPDSAIRVAYGSGERRVELLSGAAFFRVVHNAGKPFRVNMEGIETTDLGTAFEVRRGGEGAMVAVQQGSVRVDYPSVRPVVSRTLRAGQAVRLGWAGAAAASEEPADQVAAWRHNQLIAQDAPMRDVVARLRPYYQGRIIVADAGLANRTVTGVYNLADPVDALRGIAQAHGATVWRITPWLLVVSPG